MSTRDWIEVLGFIVSGAFSAGVTWATVRFQGRATRAEVSDLKARVQELEFCVGVDTHEVLQQIGRMVEAVLKRKKRG